MLAARAVATPGAAAAGFLVNTMGWIDGLGYELIRHAIAALRVDVVLVLGQDRLHSVLSQECAALPQRPSVVKLGKSGGVVLRSQEYRKLCAPAAAAGGAALYPCRPLFRGPGSCPDCDSPVAAT